MPFSPIASSVRWRLSLLILALLATIGLAFAWTAHREMRRALRMSGDARLRAAAAQVSDLILPSVAPRLADARRLAADAAVRQFVTTGEGRDAAMATLQAYSSKYPQVKISLITRGGTEDTRLATGAVTMIRSPKASDEPAPAADGFGPLRLDSGRVVFSTIAVVPGAPDQPATGVLSVQRSLGSSSGGALIQRLLGSGAVLKLGNSSGDLWTDFSVPVEAPPRASPASEAVEFADVKGVRYLGNAFVLAGTPWQLWVQFDEAPLMDPARMLPRRMLLPTLALIGLGVLAVGALSARITRPLEDVAKAAAAVAAGDAPRLLEVNRRDEIGRLASTFNVMAAHVTEARDKLEARVLERTGELELARRELDQFFAISLDLLCISDAEGRFKRVNPAWEEVLGWTAADLTSKPYVGFVHPDDVAATAAEAARLAGGGVAASFENRYRCKDESYRWLNWKAAALPGGDLVYATARDVTEQKHAARELQLHAAELGAVNRELEAFSYSVSHDLRAPLRSIDGFSQALLEDAGDSLGPTGQEHLRRIRAAAQRMGRLIDDLLKLARVTRADLNVDAIDLSRMAESTLQSLAAAEPDRVVTWRIQPRLRASGDPRLIQIAMTNLLGNAWKFSSIRDRAVIELGAHTADGQTVYFVKDNGAGFDMAYVSKLFGTFQRLHQAAEFPGTGIGLATVQRIVARHGGRVWADGTVGAGATFSFTLPSHSHS